MVFACVYKCVHSLKCVCSLREYAWKMEISFEPIFLPVSITHLIHCILLLFLSFFPLSQKLYIFLFLPETQLHNSTQATTEVTSEVENKGKPRKEPSRKKCMRESCAPSTTTQCYHVFPRRHLQLSHILPTM